MTKSLLQRIIVPFKQEDFKYIEDNQIDFIVLEILEGVILPFGQKSFTYLAKFCRLPFRLLEYICLGTERIHDWHL